MTVTRPKYTCMHGRPHDSGDWIRGIPPCDDCDLANWQESKWSTIIGMLLLTALIMVPAVLILIGTMW